MVLGSRHGLFSCRLSAVFLASVLSPAASVGHTPPPTGWYLIPGLTYGGAKTLGGAPGISLGGEVSASYFNTGRFVGAVSDVVHNFGEKATRVSLGAMGGWGVFGAELSYLASMKESQIDHGIAVRPFISFGYLGGFLRYGVLFGAGDVIEGGVLLKLPLCLVQGSPWFPTL